MPAKVRAHGLDGLRGIAALFVVVHHCWLMSFSGFPVDNGPGWATWMMYGHLAVVVFIVLSGFSLGLRPAQTGWRLGDARRYAFRRAWRILPPYWPALIFSLAMAWWVVGQPGEGAPTGKSVVVYGLLLQDVFGAPSPNGAFWSIAIEAQLYVLLPILLLLIRRWNAVTLLAVVAIPVLAIGILAPKVPAIHLLIRFTPQLALAFTVGLLGAGLANNERWRRYPWHWFGLAAAIPGLVLIAVAGPAWAIPHYFWIDLLLSPAIALILAGVATGRAARLGRFLDLRPLRSLGGFSYSLYLIHAPIIVAVAAAVTASKINPGTPALLATLAVGIPSSLVAARLFAAVFDLPFQRHKTWSELRGAIPMRSRPAKAVALRRQSPVGMGSAAQVQQDLAK